MRIYGERSDGATLVSVGAGHCVVLDRRAGCASPPFDELQIPEFLGVFVDVEPTVELRQSISRRLTNSKTVPLSYFALDNRTAEERSEAAKKAWDVRGRKDPSNLEPTPQAGFSQLLDTIGKPDGGFTYHPVSGRQPKTGFALSIHKGREKVVNAKDLTLDALWEHAEQNWDLLSKPENFMGGWHNPDDGKIYLDVSTVVTDRAEAERLGREHSQLAYFDLEGGSSVTIEKKGK